MRMNYDLKDMIAGLAQLGAVYLKISEKVKAFYQENPLLWMEAGDLFKKQGERIESPDLGGLIDVLLRDNTVHPPARNEVLFLKRYIRKYDDPVLAVETVQEFLGKDRLQRMDMIAKLKEQLRLFPDPRLGLSDLREFGYVKRDMFPIGENAAIELFATRRIAVYALYEDGRSSIIDSDMMLYTHKGMFGVLKEDWISFSIQEFKTGREFLFSFRSSTKMLRIYQLKESDLDFHTCAFMPYETLEAEGISVDISRYDCIYEDEIWEEATLEDVFERFNINRPEDFRGHSLSVGDVIAFMEEGIWVYYYVQPFGFRPLDDFNYKEMSKELPGREIEEKDLPKIMERAPVKDAESLPREEPLKKHSRAR